MRIRLAVTLSAVSMLALSGCGSDLNPDLHPGAAAVVGDRELSFETVDKRAEEQCDFNRDQLVAQKVQVPMSLARTVAVQELVKDAIAEQYAEAHDLNLSTARGMLLPRLRQEAQQTLSANGAPASEADIDEYVDMVLSPRANAVYLAAAIEDDAAKARQDPEVLKTGTGLVTEWAKGLDLSIDPRFGGDADQLSTPVGDLAVQAAAFADGKSEAKDYLASLPASQKCG